MQKFPSSSWKYKAIVLIILFIIASYVFPLFYQITKLNFSIFFYNESERNSALFKSALFSFMSSSINIIISLWLAIHLSRIPLFSKKGNFLSLLILPILIGDVSTAFIGKVLLEDNTLLHENSTFKFASLILIQFWQYGTLFTYIFWLVINNIKESVKDFAKGVKLSNSEYVKDVILPATRNIAILSFVLNFVFAFFENSKSQFIYRASQGTNSEFISRWIERYYYTNSLFNINSAINNTLQIGSFVMVIVLLLVVTLSISFAIVYKRYLTSKYYFPSTKSVTLTNILYFITLLLVVAPVAGLILNLVFTTTFSLANLFPVIIITTIAALISTILAIQIGILLRLAWKKAMSTFNRNSLIFYFLLLLILIFPPLVLYILGFKWFTIIGYQSTFFIKCIWVFGHILLVLPILSSFIAVTHYRTTNYEIEFLDAYKLNYKDKTKALFNRRYFLDYSLTFLISFSFIWNESTINNLLSDFIPSFISELKMSISGRATDYSSGIGYFFISLLIALVSITLWNFIMRNTRTKLM